MTAAVATSLTSLAGHLIVRQDQRLPSCDCTRRSRLRSYGQFERRCEDGDSFDLSQSTPKLSDRLATEWFNNLRGDLLKRHENERTLCHTWVRNSERRRRDDV